MSPGIALEQVAEQEALNALPRLERVSLEVKDILSSLSFQVSEQSHDEEERRVKDFSGPAMYVARRTFQQEGTKPIEVQIAYTPNGITSQRGVMFSVRFYINGEDMGGNHDMNSGEFKGMLVNTIVCATFGIDYGKLSWDSRYTAERERLSGQLADMDLLSWKY